MEPFRLCKSNGFKIKAWRTEQRTEEKLLTSRPASVEPTPTLMFRHPALANMLHQTQNNRLLWLNLESCLGDSSCVVSAPLGELQVEESLFSSTHLLVIEITVMTQSMALLRNCGQTCLFFGTEGGRGSTGQRPHICLLARMCTIAMRPVQAHPAFKRNRWCLSLIDLNLVMAENLFINN